MKDRNYLKIYQYFRDNYSIHDSLISITNNEKLVFDIYIQDGDLAIDISNNDITVVSDSLNTKWVYNPLGLSDDEYFNSMLNYSVPEYLKEPEIQKIRHLIKEAIDQKISFYQHLQSQIKEIK